MFFGDTRIAHRYDLFRNSAIIGTSKIDTAGVRFDTQKDVDRHNTIQKANLPMTGIDRLNHKCIVLLDQQAKYMVGEFDIHNDDYLLELWEPLIKAWYYGRVWVIKDESIMLREIAMAESAHFRDSIPEYKLYRGNPFRLFEFQRVHTNDKGERVFLYRSLLTGIEAFELNPEELISISNDDGQTFYYLWSVYMDHLAGQVRGVEAHKASSKTVNVTIRNKNNFENESSQIENPSVFFKTYRQTGDTALEQNIYQEMPLIETARVKDLLDINDEMTKKALAFVGVISNSTEKKERLTVAENLKDSRLMTNIQDRNLKCLKVFEMKLKEKGWVSDNCRIEIAGLSLNQQDSENPDLFNAQPLVEKNDEALA